MTTPTSNPNGGWTFGGALLALLVVIVAVWFVKEVIFAPTTCVIGCNFESE